MSKRGREEAAPPAETSIYLLPKDILVRLVATIERDTREPLAARLAAAEEKLCFMKRAGELFLMHYEYCQVHGCLARRAYNDHSMEYYTENCEFLDYCQECEYPFCNLHLSADYQLCPGCVIQKPF